MKMLFGFFVLMVITLGAPGCTPVDNTGVKHGLITLGDNESLYRLTGTWLFHSGDGTEKPPNINSKKWRDWRVADGQETLKLDATERYSSWLRLDFILSPDFKKESLAVLLPSNGNYTVLLNQNKIRKYKAYGEIVQTGTSLLRLESAYLKPGKNQLLLMGDRLVGVSGPSPEIYLGKEALVETRYLGHWAWNITISGIFIFFGLYHLFLFYKRPAEKSYLWLAILLICSAIYVLSSAYLIFAIYPSTWIWLIWWYTLGIMFPASMMFFYRVFAFPITHWFPRIMAGAFLVWNIIPTLDFILHDWTVWTFKFGILLIAPLTPLMHGIIITQLIKAIRQTQIGAIRMLVAYLIYLGATVNDQLVNQNIYLMPLVIGEGMLFFMLSLVFAQGTRFAKVHDDLDKSYRVIEDQNKNLEIKVEQRTEELQESLSDIKLLKVHQDGDYFLTSLILNPLGQNHVKSEYVDIETLIKQKKQFFFKKWDSEIGGDINIAHSIVLEKRTHIVFLNGDAMGKSLQGAGGALVLGAIFHSIIERVKNSALEQKKPPEIWLENTYLELKKVFESFDGSMLFSMVLGLIDEQNGFVYFVNAEHPFSIVYRNHKASFIENELLVRKLGTMYGNTELFIQFYQMKPGDALILGSDGRDDILLGMDAESGQRTINENEELILGVLEQSKGDLKETLKNLQAYGELTDDTSFLKITFKQDLKTWEAARVNAQERRDNIKIRLNEGDWANALREGLMSLKNDPSHNVVLLQSSYAAKMYGSFRIAAVLGERMLLRESGHIGNLLNLIDIYLNYGDARRAEELVTTMSELGSGEETLPLLQSALQQLKEGSKVESPLIKEASVILAMYM